MTILDYDPKAKVTAQPTGLVVYPASPKERQREDARMMARASQIEQIIQNMLSERFGRMTAQGKRYPQVRGAMGVWGCFVVVEVNVATLFERVTIELLSSQPILDWMEGILRWPVYALTKMLTPDREIKGLWYIVAISKLPPALPAVPAQVRLASHYPFDPIQDYPTGQPLKWLVGHNGKQIEWVDLWQVKMGMYGGSTQQGKTVSLKMALAALLFNNGPEILRLGYIDVKGLDSFWLENSPHLLDDVVCGAQSVEAAGKLLYLGIEEMERRREIMKGRAENLLKWNEKCPNRAMPLWLFVWDDFTTMLALAGKKSPAYHYLTSILSAGAALGIRVILGVHNPTAKILDTFNRGLIDSRFIFHTPDLGGFMNLAGGTGELNAFWPELDRPGRALALISGATPRRVQVPIMDTEQLSALATAYWGEREGSHAENQLIIPPLTVSQYRLAAWSSLNTPGTMSRNKLAEAFDERRLRGGETADGGPNINEDAIRDIMNGLRANDLLTGGGRQGVVHRTTQRLVELVDQCEQLSGFRETLSSMEVRLLESTSEQLDEMDRLEEGGGVRVSSLQPPTAPTAPTQKL